MRCKENRGEWRVHLIFVVRIIIMPCVMIALHPTEKSEKRRRVYETTGDAQGQCSDAENDGRVIDSELRCAAWRVTEGLRTEETAERPGTQRVLRIPKTGRE